MMEEIIKKARGWIEKEIELNGSPLLSLDICKKELEPYYHEFKKLIADARAWC